MDRPLVVLAVFAVLWLCSFYEPRDVAGGGIVLHKLVALTDATLKRLSLGGRNRRATALPLRGANHSIHVWREHHSCSSHGHGDEGGTAGVDAGAFVHVDDDAQQQQAQKRAPQRRQGSSSLYVAQGSGPGMLEEDTCEGTGRESYVTHQHYFKSKLTAATTVAMGTSTIASDSVVKPASQQQRREGELGDEAPPSQLIVEACAAMVQDLRLLDQAEHGGFLDMWSTTGTKGKGRDTESTAPAWARAALNHYLWTGGLSHATTPLQELVNRTHGLRYGGTSASDPTTVGRAEQHSCIQRLRALVAADASTLVTDMLSNFTRGAALDTIALRVIRPSSEVPFHTTPPAVVASEQNLSQDDAAACHHLGLRRHNRRPRITVSTFLPHHSDHSAHGVKAVGRADEGGSEPSVASGTERDAGPTTSEATPTPTLIFCNLGPREQCLQVDARPGTVVAFDSDSVMHAIKSPTDKAPLTTERGVVELSVSFLLPQDDRYKPPTADAVRRAVKDDIYRRNRLTFREYLFNNPDMKQQMMDYIVQQSIVFPGITSPVQFNVCMLLDAASLPRAVLKAFGCQTRP